MKQGLSLRVSQHLALTPQLQQSIRLLQLSTLELSHQIEQMLDDNPFLELDDEAASTDLFAAPAANAPAAADEGADASPAEEWESPAPASPEQEMSDQWEGDGAVELNADDGEWGGDAPARNPPSDASEDRLDATDLAREHLSLAEHLRQQALGLRLSPPDRAALAFLIDSLNDDGYLEDSLESLAHSLAGADEDAAAAALECLSLALRWLHNLEPTGVGARNLAECLRLQLQARPAEPLRDLALRLCAQPMELLARRDFKRLAVLCGHAEAELRAALALVAQLEPKPGRRFANVERNRIVPDVIVSKSGRQFRVQLNSDVMPRLRVHELYANALRSHKSAGGAPALQQRLQEARWFIKNIQQRFDTILRVSQAIVERQKNFFAHGELAMRPLVLREIADELGLHESTISRVTTAKYMATPWGTFELKYFFGSGLNTDAGGNASSIAVRALIKQFVASEDANRPLSDNQISDMLKEQGIACARRTVAKYRESLRIAPTSLRKTL